MPTPLPSVAFIAQRKFPPEAGEELSPRPEYPELKSWATLTSRVLTKELYNDMTRSLAGGINFPTDSGGALCIGAAFDHVIRGACDGDYVDYAVVSRGGGAFERAAPPPGCVALSAESYRYFRRFFERIVAASRGGQPTFKRSERRKKMFEDLTRKMETEEAFLTEADRYLKTVRIRYMDYMER